MAIAELEMQIQALSDRVTALEEAPSGVTQLAALYPTTEVLTLQGEWDDGGILMDGAWDEGFALAYDPVGNQIRLLAVTADRYLTPPSGSPGSPAQSPEISALIVYGERT